MISMKNVTNGNLSLGVSIGQDSHISDKRTLCANLVLIQKGRASKSIFLRWFLSRSFLIGGIDTKLLNQFDY